MSFRYAVYLLFVVSHLFLSCSTSRDQGEATQVSRNILEEVDADIPIIETDPQDASSQDPCSDGGPHCGSEFEYQQRCWKAQLWFCTPTGAPPGDDPTLYQQQVVLDICDESGNPCVPEQPNDPNCRWEIIDLGECEDWLECDPTSSDQIIEENVACQVTNPDGTVSNGVQTLYCNKGNILAGPCEPCSEEICDGVDNDCDGDTDEGVFPCESECGAGEAVCVDGQLQLCTAPQPSEEICDYQDNNCNGLVDEGQLNACGDCGPVADEFCNGIDDDCDGLIDEELIQLCETPCEAGYQQCISGQWGPCSAQAPVDEICNGSDDDCDGLVDNGISCECSQEDVGVLVPCLEPPLLCGQGFKTCECLDVACGQTQMTACKSVCSYQLPEPAPECDESLGFVLPETCNNWDDNCNQLTDEDLVAQCYTGPDETLGVGICLPGEAICVDGQWGNYPDQDPNQNFFPLFCYGEVLPNNTDLCNGADDNCDGVVEEVMEPTDILFIIDGSGSMSQELDAVLQALTLFAANYSDEQVIRWGLVVGPVEEFGVERLVLLQNLSPFDQFMFALANAPNPSGGNEMLLDAIYLAIENLVPPLLLPHVPGTLVWDDDVSSTPPLGQFSIPWREDANRVLIVFSDEEPQSFLIPELSHQEVSDVANNSEDLRIYTFSPGNFNPGWADLAANGQWFSLTSDAEIMYQNLMEIIDEAVCGNP